MTDTSTDTSTGATIATLLTHIALPVRDLAAFWG